MHLLRIDVLAPETDAVFPFLIQVQIETHALFPQGRGERESVVDDTCRSSTVCQIKAGGVSVRTFRRGERSALLLGCAFGPRNRSSRSASEDRKE